MPSMTIGDEIRRLVAEEFKRVLEPTNERLHRLERALSESNRAAESEVCSMLTTKAAAEFMHVSPSTIRSWVHAGTLTRHGTSRSLRVNRAELLALGTPREDDPGVDVGAHALRIARKHGAR